MKREIKNSFEIKLEFAPNTKNPFRLFQSYAEIIDGITSINSVITRSVNSDYTKELILEDLEKGSIVGKFIDWITVNEDDTIDNIKDNEAINSYIHESRNETLKFIENKKYKVSELKELKEKLEDIAAKQEIKNTFNYASPGLIDLAKSINQIVNSTKKLNDTEKYTFATSNDMINVDNKSQTIDIEKVEEELTENEIITQKEAYYKIKKPDFLGNTQWEFKHGNTSPKAKISHQAWLDGFLAGKIPVVPGDSLKVLVKQTTKYDKNGYVLFDKFEIVEVLEVIHNN